MKTSDLTYAAEQYIDVLLSQVREKKIIGLNSALIHCDPSLCRWGHWADAFRENEDLLSRINSVSARSTGLGILVQFTSIESGYDEVWYDTIDDGKYLPEMIGQLPSGKLAESVEQIAKCYYKEDLLHFSRRHPYKLKRSFGSWENILATMACCKGFFGARSSYRAADLCEWDQEMGPVYCVSTEIAHEFMLAEFNESLLESLFSDNENLPSILFVFEDGAFPVLLDLFVRFAIVRKSSEAISLTFYHDRHADTSLAEYIVIIRPGGNSEKEKMVLERDRRRDSPDFTSWAKSVSSIILQCALAVQNEPSLVSGPEEAQGPIGQAMKPSKGSKRVLRPRWLGKNYVRPAVRTSHGGTHLSPHPHWRKAHWRQQPCGPKGRERRLTLVRSVFVRGQSTSHG
jgi:hypothetical protein